MTVPATDFIASGCPYRVTAIAGRPPAALDDFVGDTTFVIVRGDQTCGVVGVGRRTESDVRFYEKDHGTGRDVRIWQVSATDDQAFHATALSNY